MISLRYIWSKRQILERFNDLLPYQLTRNLLHKLNDPTKSYYINWHCFCKLHFISWTVNNECGVCVIVRSFFYKFFFAGNTLQHHRFALSMMNMMKLHTTCRCSSLLTYFVYDENCIHASGVALEIGWITY